MNNRKRLESMTDEELAAWLADHPVVSEFDPTNPDHVEWYTWLNREEGTL